MKNELMKLDKEQLAELVTYVIIRYKKDIDKLPLVYCPLCNSKLR